MREDSELFLSIVLEKSKEIGKNTFILEKERFSEICDYENSVDDILDELKRNDCINSSSTSFGDMSVEVSLTSEGRNYFSKKKSDSSSNQIITNNFNFESSSNATIITGVNNTINNGFNYEDVRRILNDILKYEEFFQSEFGENSQIVKELLEEIKLLVENKEEPSLIKKVCKQLKETVIVHAGSVLVHGILELINSIEAFK